MSVLSVCMYVYHMCADVPTGAHRSQKKSLDPLELDLWTAVSHHMGAGNHTQVFHKSSKCLWTLSHLFHTAILS